MIIKITFILILIVFVVAIILGFRYSSWKASKLEQISSSSLIANLPTGPMEYSLVGDADSPVLLYLHGSPGGYDHAIIRKGYQVLTPSRPGYLNTPISVGASPQEQAHAYKGLMEFLEIKSAVVTGASGGGPSAIAFAAMYPKQTELLILIEAVSDSMPLPAMPSLMESDFSFWLVMGTLERILGVEGMAKRFIPDEANSNRVITNPAKLSQFSKTIWSVWPYSKRRQGWENDRDYFLELDLPAERISAPTLIVHGSGDASVSSELSQRLAEVIPDAHLELIEGADHMMPFTHEEELADVVEHFHSKYR
ncbi:MAG: alpha/beta hydrolase [Pseudomonadales bacterium]